MTDNTKSTFSEEEKELSAQVNIPTSLQPSFQNQTLMLKHRTSKRGLTLEIPGETLSQSAILSNDIGVTLPSIEENAPTPVNTPSSIIPPNEINPFTSPTPANTPSTRVPTDQPNPFLPPTTSYTLSSSSSSTTTATRSLSSSSSFNQSNQFTAPTPANTPSTRVPTDQPNPFAPPITTQLPSISSNGNSIHVSTNSSNQFTAPTPANTPSTRVPTDQPNPFAPPTAGNLSERSINSGTKKSKSNPPKSSFNPNNYFVDDDSEPEELDINVRLKDEAKHLQKEEQIEKSMSSKSSTNTTTSKNHLPTKKASNPKIETTNLSSVNDSNLLQWSLVAQGEYNIDNITKQVTLSKKIFQNSSVESEQKRKKNFFQLIVNDPITKQHVTFYFDCPSEINTSSSIQYKPILDQLVQQHFLSSHSNNQLMLIHQSNVEIQGGNAQVTVFHQPNSSGLLFQIQYFSGKLGFEQFIETRRLLSAGLISSTDFDLTQINFSSAIQMFFGYSFPIENSRNLLQHPNTIAPNQFYQQQQQQRIDNNSQMNTMIISVSVIISVFALLVALFSSMRNSH